MLDFGGGSYADPVPSLNQQGVSSLPPRPKPVPLPPDGSMSAGLPRHEWSHDWAHPNWAQADDGTRQQRQQERQESYLLNLLQQIAFRNFGRGPGGR